MTVLVRNMRNLRQNDKLVIQFRAAVNHYRDGHKSAKTNKVDRNPPITSKQDDFSKPLQRRTCISRGRSRETNFDDPLCSHGT